jgi:MFS family permease
MRSSCSEAANEARLNLPKGEWTTMNRSKLWTKDFIMISCANFFAALIFYLLMTTVTQYAAEQFQASQSQAGLATSIFIIGALFSRLFAGKYIEVIGRKKMLYASLLTFLFISLLYFPVQHLNLFFVIRFLHGFSFGFAGTAMATAVMDMIPQERRGEGTSYFSLSATAAAAVGPFLGLLISLHADYRILFLTSIACAVLMIVSFLFVNIPEARLTDEQLRAMKRGFGLHDFFEKNAAPISIVMILMGIAYSSIIAFLNSYAIEVQLTDAAGFFFMVYSVFLFISRPFTGRLLDRKGDNIVIYPALVVFSLSLFVLSQARHDATLLLAGALAALGFGTLMSCAQAIAVKVSPKHRVGLATSTFFICLDSGMGLGPFLLGLLIPLVDYRGMYASMAAVVLLSIFLYYLVHGKRASRSADVPSGSGVPM